MPENAYQQRYWNQLKELRTHVIYLHLYAAQSEFWDKTINIFLALTSTSSIAAWAIWQEYQIVWAIIIASSQVVTVIKPFLPHKQRIKVVSELNDKVQQIFLECEKNWYLVAEGQLTEEQIHDKYIEIRNEILSAERKYLKDTILPKKPRLLCKAEDEADTYFQNNYMF